MRHALMRVARVSVIVMAIVGTGYLGLAQGQEVPTLTANDTDGSQDPGLDNEVAPSVPATASAQERLQSDDQLMCESLAFFRGSGPGGPLMYTVLLSLPFLYLARLRRGFRLAQASG